MTYHDEVHPGEHPAIVEKDVWEKVQAVLGRNGNTGGAVVRNKYGALLKGLASLIAARSAQKRDHRRARALDRVPEERFGRELDVPLDLHIDVHDALATLPADLRPVADLFARLTEAEVIRASGLSRQQVRGRRERIALHLRTRGLP